MELKKIGAFRAKKAKKKGGWGSFRAAHTHTALIWEYPSQEINQPFPIVLPEDPAQHDSDKPTEQQPYSCAAGTQPVYRGQTEGNELLT